MVFFQLVRLQRAVSASAGSPSETVAELTPAAHEALAGLTDPLVPISIVIQHQQDWENIVAAVDRLEGLDASALAAALPWHSHSIQQEGGVWAYLPSDGMPLDDVDQSHARISNTKARLRPIYLFACHHDHSNQDPENAGNVAQPSDNNNSSDDDTHDQQHENHLSLSETLLRWTILCSLWFHMVVPDTWSAHDLSTLDSVIRPLAAVIPSRHIGKRLMKQKLPSPASPFASMARHLVWTIVGERSNAAHPYSDGQTNQDLSSYLSTSGISIPDTLFHSIVGCFHSAECQFSASVQDTGVRPVCDNLEEKIQNLSIRYDEPNQNAPKTCWIEDILTEGNNMAMASYHFERTLNGPSYLSYATSALSALQRPSWAENPLLWKVIDTSAWEILRESAIKAAKKAYHESMNQFLDQHPMPLQWHALAMAHQRAQAHGERIIGKHLSSFSNGLPKLIKEFRQLCMTAAEDSQGVPKAGLYLEYYNINAAALQNYHINSLEEHWQHCFKSRMADIKEYSQFLLAVDLVRKSYLETCIPCPEAISTLDNLEDMQQSVSTTFLRMLNNYPEHNPSSRATKTLSLTGSSILHAPPNSHHHLRGHHLHQHQRKDAPSSTDTARPRTHHNDASAIMASINSIEQQIADILQGRQAAEEQAKAFEKVVAPTTQVVKPKASNTSRNTTKDHDSKMAVQFGWTLHMLHANTLQYAWIWTWLYSHEGSSRQNVVACDNKMYTATKWIILPAKDQIKTRKDWKVNFGDRVWLVSYWFSTRNAKMMLPEYMPRARGMPCRHLIPYGETYVICKTCPAEILCMRCFRASDHTDHTMYLQCSWGTSVCVCGDVSRLKPGHDLHCSLHCAEEHRAYSSLARGKQCSFKFKAGAKVFRCRTCQIDQAESAVICDRCFRSHNHFGHDYIALSAEEGSVCCCNDNKSWKPPTAPSCQYHDAGPLDPAYAADWLTQTQPQQQQQLTRSSNSRRCGHVFQPGEDIYHCRDCSLNELTVLCSRCFHGSNCVQHRWRMGEFQGTTRRRRRSRAGRRRSSAAASTVSSLSVSSCCSSTTSSASTAVEKRLPSADSKERFNPKIMSRGAGWNARHGSSSEATTSDGHNMTNQRREKGKARRTSQDGQAASSSVVPFTPPVTSTSTEDSADSDDQESDHFCGRDEEEALRASDLECRVVGELDLDNPDEEEDEDDEDDDQEYGEADEEDDDEEEDAPISCDCGDPAMFKSAFDCNYHLPEEYRPIPHLKFCNYQFRVQEIMYHCRTCHVPGSWICVRCYDAVQHAGHPIDQARNEKNEGRYCKCGDQQAMLAKLECRDDHNRQNILCVNDIKEGVYYYSCETCRVDSGSLFCEDCFIKVAHEGHNYQRLCAPAGFETTRCACGENSAFRYATHCDQHERVNGTNITHRCYYVSKAGEWIATCSDCYPPTEIESVEGSDSQSAQQADSATTTVCKKSKPNIPYLCIRCRQGSDHTNHRLKWIQLHQDMTYPCACGSALGFEPNTRPLCQYHTTLHKTVPSTTLYLHSHSHRSLNHPDHNEVTGFRYHDSDNDWIVCRPEGVGTTVSTAVAAGGQGSSAGGSSSNNSNGHQGTTAATSSTHANSSSNHSSPYLQWRDVFWLKHANTGLYLNSMANLKIPQGFQEVTTIAGLHSNNDWIIEETTWLRQQILSDE